MNRELIISFLLGFAIGLLVVLTINRLKPLLNSNVKGILHWYPKTDFGSYCHYKYLA